MRCPAALRRWIVLATVLLLAVVFCPAQATTASKPSTTKKTTSKKHSRKRRPRGQQKMDAKRVQEIQDALVRENYLSKASGKWDTATQNAMQRFQADNGWQTKVLPDSRALIKLGLGPDHDHLLNPESAMTSMPESHPVPAEDSTGAKKP
jgi:hypothetical protein